MSGRNRGPPLPMKSAPHPVLAPPHPGLAPPHPGLAPGHEPPFGRNLGPMPHPALLEELRESQFAMGARQLPPHPAIIEEHLAAQHQDIQALLGDNQRLAATHVALKQELEAVHHELQQTDHYARSFFMEKDMHIRELFDKSAKLEADLRGVEAMRADLMQVHNDIKELTAERQALTAQVHAMTQDLARFNAQLQQTPALKAEIESLRQEVQHARAAIEHERKVHAENYEHGQVMEKNLISMARELEKLRAEMGNADKRAHAAAAVGNPNPGTADKRAHAAAAVGNPNPGYNGNYGNPEVSYPGNLYAAGYGQNTMNPIIPQGMQPGGEKFPQYGPGPGAWGAYDMQRAQGHR